MKTKKPVLVLQLRPEDVIPDKLNLDDYSAIIVGGSPFDISTPAEKKSAIQKKIGANFNRLLQHVVERKGVSLKPTPYVQELLTSPSLP